MEPLERERRKSARYLCSSHAEFAGDKGVEAWLTYMPCKVCVVSGQIAFLDSAPESQTKWPPTDFPETIGEFSRRYGLRFVDLTPARVQASRLGATLSFNPFYETHINAAGARVVAEEIARCLRGKGM